MRERVWITRTSLGKIVASHDVVKINIASGQQFPCGFQRFQIDIAQLHIITCYYNRFKIALCSHVLKLYRGSKSLLDVVLDVRQEGMKYAVHSRGSLSRVKSQHWHQPVREVFSPLGFPLIFFRQHVIKGPRLQFSDVT